MRSLACTQFLTGMVLGGFGGELSFYRRLWVSCLNANTEEKS